MIHVIRTAFGVLRQRHLASYTYNAYRKTAYIFRLRGGSLLALQREVGALLLLSGTLPFPRLRSFIRSCVRAFWFIICVRSFVLFWRANAVTATSPPRELQSKDVHTAPLCTTIKPSINSLQHSNTAVSLLIMPCRHKEY